MKIIILIFIIIINPILVEAQGNRYHIQPYNFCYKTAKPSPYMFLNADPLDEISGIALNKEHIFYINDSGDGEHIYFTKHNTSYINRLIYTGKPFKDAEDLSYGKCGNQKCLFIADIGDNCRNRDYISFIMFTQDQIDKSRQKDNKTLPPSYILNATYPDGKSYNSESVALHPNGDIYLITKTAGAFLLGTKREKMAKIFKIPKEKVLSNKTVNLQHVANIDMSKLAPTDQNKIITSFDFFHDGSKFLILTYDNAIEIDLDLSKIQDPITINNYNRTKIIELIHLPQQEAIAYFLDSNDIIYTTELEDNSSDNVPLYYISCNSE